MQQKKQQKNMQAFFFIKALKLDVYNNVRCGWEALHNKYQTCSDVFFATRW